MSDGAGERAEIARRRRTTPLDVTIQAQILDCFERAEAAARHGDLLITHNLGIVGDMADPWAVMYAGQIVDCARERLLRKPFHPYRKR